MSTEIRNQISRPLMSELVKINPEKEKELKQLFFKVAKNEMSGFYVRDENKDVYNLLFRYFLGLDCDIDTSKCIYLYGDYGSGKTTCMKMFSKFLSVAFPFSPNGFGLTSVEKIADEFKQDGSLIRFVRNGEKPFQICINEIGKPFDEKYYGTSIQNVINSMLMGRYELFQDEKICTHATSNYHPSELECFDTAILDRFNEMYNFIEFKGDSLRK